MRISRVKADCFVLLLKRSGFLIFVVHLQSRYGTWINSILTSWKLYLSKICNVSRRRDEDKQRVHLIHLFL